MNEKSVELDVWARHEGLMLCGRPNPSSNSEASSDHRLARGVGVRGEGRFGCEVVCDVRDIDVQRGQKNVRKCFRKRQRGESVDLPVSL